MDICSWFCIPDELLSDQGTQFLSDCMKEVCRLLGIKQKMSKPYHPLCNGLVERFHATLKTCHCRQCHEQPQRCIDISILFSLPTERGIQQEKITTSTQHRGLSPQVQDQVKFKNMLRTTLVNRKQALKAVKELDAFPKVPESYVETSAKGGGLSIVTFILIFILILSEVSYYANTELQFDYVVDTNFTGKLKLNIDVTVAMECFNVGADVLDQTGQDVFGFGLLEEEPVFWELSPKQREYQQMIQSTNSFLNEEYHALQTVLWRSGNPTFNMGMPVRETPNPPGEKDGCRLHGSLEVNKVAGNFHITAGKSIPVIPKGHAHLAMMMENSDYNFSHRIDHFSFGDPVSGLIYPLDGSEITTSYNQHTFQYFMKVVPTEVRTYRANVDTYQFSVTERNRPISHSQGSHGVPGIFVKYDLSSLVIRIKEVHKPFWQFLVRLCGIVGGIFSVSGMLNGFMGFLTDLVCCRLKQKSQSQGNSRYDGGVASPDTSPLMHPDILNTGNFCMSSSANNSDVKPELLPPSNGSIDLDAGSSNSKQSLTSLSQSGSSFNS
ncbi:endoplasmic reticulum-Golgi intermediate compartment protein 2-like [Plakobranchus ocellatus]|uniref:Endoplasmic reticulum-Golgi intermediate compartment protein 2-like n=1 Tax=Plakobranchus ocellatus TaxID=259542 RepID=A0AAV4D661_9GAST|nr:endoplasmic reticulum-Golgi intermediate compartment protein 2-like [Plakobranchus ocellatus]